MYSFPALWNKLSAFGKQWAELREAQLKSLSVPNTAMAVAIDLGEWNDIHPDRKKDVGESLALAAEKIAYGEKILFTPGLFINHQLLKEIKSLFLLQILEVV